MPSDQFRRLIRRRTGTAYRVIDEDELLGETEAQAADWRSGRPARARPALTPLVVASVALVFMAALLVATHRSTPTPIPRQATTRHAARFSTTLLRVARDIQPERPRPARRGWRSASSHPSRARVSPRRRLHRAAVPSHSGSVEPTAAPPPQPVAQRMPPARETAVEFGFER